MNIKLDINVCRVCLGPESELSMLKDESLAEKFLYCTQIKVKQDDGMPTALCNRCAVRLKVSYEFRRQSLVSHLHMIEFIDKVNNQFKEVTDSNFAKNDEILNVNDEDINLLTEIEDKNENSEHKYFEYSENSEVKLIIPNEIEDERKLAEEIEDDLTYIHDDDSEEQQYVEETHLEEETQSEELQQTFQKESDVLEETPLLATNSYVVPLNFKEQELIKRPKNENRVHICIKCDKDFTTKTNLMRHMLTHDGVKPFQCTICGNGFTQNGSLKQHMLIHTGERPHKCHVCGRGFTQAKSLIFHLRRHTGEKPYSCDKCELTFRQRDGLKRHELCKHNEVATEIHICPICQKSLHSKYSLFTHMKKHTGNQSENEKCEICGKFFSSKTSLENHLRHHTGEKPYHCEKCGKEFSRKGQLMLHIKSHVEQLPAIENDEILNGKTNQSQSLIRKSQPPKNYQCGKCYKSFAIKSNLLQHLRNHNKDSIQMFKCEECDIGFNTKRAVKLHRFNDHKETVSDLNECDICHIPFVSVNDLNNHMISVHDSIDAKCDLCDERFTSKKMFEDHTLEHELMTIN